MLKLIFGASGSGKSTYLEKAVREDVKARKRCYLIVPDQQEFITESSYLHILPPDARAARFFPCPAAALIL